MTLRLFDSVATLHPIDVARLTLVEPLVDPADQLARGQVGTVVDVVDQAGGKQYLVEFADQDGREYALAHLN